MIRKIDYNKENITFTLESKNYFGKVIVEEIEINKMILKKGEKFIYMTDSWMLHTDSGSTSIKPSEIKNLSDEEKVIIKTYKF